MPIDSSFFLPLDPITVDQLACPACLGGVRFDEGNLVCEECGRIYPVVDGIPILIAERAELEAIPGAPLA
jgi:uncharacterized protein YbaR (Trm112 family)